MTTLPAHLSRIPRPARVAAGEVVLIAAALGCVLLSHPNGPAYALPSAVVACLLLPLRLRWTWAAMLLCLLAQTGSLGLAPSVVALYRVGRRCRAPVVLGWATASVLAMELPVLLPGVLPIPDAVLSVSFAVLCATGPAALGALVGTRAKLTASLAELRRVREGELAAREEKARALERARVAQEIHDAVGHHTTLLAVEAAAVAATGEHEDTRRFARRVRELTTRSLAEMRAALGLINGALDANDGAADTVPAPGHGLAEVPGLVDRVRRSGVPVRLRDEGGTGVGLGPVAGRAVYRIVQESLTNAAKHAPGAPVVVHLAQDDGHYLVTVTTGPAVAGTVSGGAVTGGAVSDAASGGASGDADSGGLGLAGLAERARTVGGSLEVERADGDRFTVRARLPLGGYPLRK